MRAAQAAQLFVGMILSLKAARRSDQPFNADRDPKDFDQRGG
jgi:hypothetical protein